MNDEQNAWQWDARKREEPPERTLRVRRAVRIRLPEGQPVQGLREDHRRLLILLERSFDQLGA
jgi:hypothetical protein